MLHSRPHVYSAIKPVCPGAMSQQEISEGLTRFPLGQGWVLQDSSCRIYNHVAWPQCAADDVITIFCLQTPHGAFQAGGLQAKKGLDEVVHPRTNPPMWFEVLQPNTLHETGCFSFFPFFLVVPHNPRSSVADCYGRERGFKGIKPKTFGKMSQSWQRSSWVEGMGPPRQSSPGHA